MPWLVRLERRSDFSCSCLRGLTILPAPLAVFNLHNKPLGWRDRHVCMELLRRACACKRSALGRGMPAAKYHIFPSSRTDDCSNGWCKQLGTEPEKEVHIELDTFLQLAAKTEEGNSHCSIGIGRARSQTTHEVGVAIALLQHAQDGLPHFLWRLYRSSAAVTLRLTLRWAAAQAGRRGSAPVHAAAAMHNQLCCYLVAKKNFARKAALEPFATLHSANARQSVGWSN